MDRWLRSSWKRSRPALDSLQEVRDKARYELRAMDDFSELGLNAAFGSEEKVQRRGTKVRKHTRIRSSQMLLKSDCRQPEYYFLFRAFLN